MRGSAATSRAASLPRRRSCREGRELEILNEVKDGVPPEVFTKVHANPVNKTPDDMRSNLRQAVMLLKEAGWEIKDGGLTNVQSGQKMQVEFLLNSPLFERIVQPYVQNLDRLGIKSTIRMVDSAQYTRRLNGFDYDIVVGNFAQSDSPGNEQRDFWGSEVGRPGGQHQSDRSEEPGHRQADRPRDLRQGSRRAGRRHQRAGPGAAVERPASCRNGTRPMCASPIGTDTANPNSCRA